MNISVLGAGQMGNGIAHVMALAGHQVHLVDVTEIRIQQAIETIESNLARQVKKERISEDEASDALAKIKGFSELKDAVADSQLVIEAASEVEELKLNLFNQLGQLTSKDCVLASNTSSISITKIASATLHPERVIGMHFMNPVPVMKLVEIINGYNTAPQVSEFIVSLSKEIGKIPVVVSDYSGFVSNRILMPMLNEAIYALFQSVAGVEEIDTVMKLGMAHPMGPLELADYIGLDTCLSILRVLQEGFGDQKYAPCPLLVNMVQAGKLGVKSGEGFYEYTPGSKEKQVASQFS